MVNVSVITECSAPKFPQPLTNDNHRSFQPFKPSAQACAISPKDIADILREDVKMRATRIATLRGLASIPKEWVTDPDVPAENLSRHANSHAKVGPVLADDFKALFNAANPYVEKLLNATLECFGCKTGVIEPEETLLILALKLSEKGSIHAVKSFTIKLKTALWPVLKVNDQDVDFNEAALIVSKMIEQAYYFSTCGLPKTATNAAADSKKMIEENRQNFHNLRINTANAFVADLLYEITGKNTSDTSLQMSEEILNALARTPKDTLAFRLSENCQSRWRIRIMSKKRNL